MTNPNEQERAAALAIIDDALLEARRWSLGSVRVHLSFAQAEALAQPASEPVKATSAKVSEGAGGSLPRQQVVEGDAMAAAIERSATPLEQSSEGCAAPTHSVPPVEARELAAAIIAKIIQHDESQILGETTGYEHLRQFLTPVCATALQRTALAAMVQMRHHDANIAANRSDATVKELWLDNPVTLVARIADAIRTAPLPEPSRTELERHDAEVRDAAERNVRSACELALTGEPQFRLEWLNSALERLLAEEVYRFAVDAAQDIRTNGTYRLERLAMNVIRNAVAEREAKAYEWCAQWLRDKWHMESVAIDLIADLRQSASGEEK